MHTEGSDAHPLLNQTHQVVGEDHSQAAFDGPELMLQFPEKCIVRDRAVAEL
jgi:hypothetical protein